MSVPHEGRSLRLQQHPIRPGSMNLYALDVWVRRPFVLTDCEHVRETLLAAADAGGANVVGEEFYVFPNGAVTGVLLLAQSHLSIHTWPEYGLANVDLLSYGDIDAEAATSTLGERLEAERARTITVPRAVG